MKLRVDLRAVVVRDVSASKLIIEAWTLAAWHKLRSLNPKHPMGGVNVDAGKVGRVKIYDALLDVHLATVVSTDTNFSEIKDDQGLHSHWFFWMSFRTTIESLQSAGALIPCEAGFLSRDAMGRRAYTANPPKVNLSWLRLKQQRSFRNLQSFYHLGTCRTT